MITTIITTYKRPKLLKRAIESVLKQTHGDFRVCVYDNASGDETEAIVQDFMKRDARVKYHRHPENIGMMANYAYAFFRIDTPYFSFLSDDDFLLPCFYETALKAFEQCPDAGFSACGVVQINGNGVFVGDPLTRWQREGYYEVPDGILEMIDTEGKLPVPTGILFNRGELKNIVPDWSLEIQLLWDPDYIMKIAAQLPIVITKKSCAVYMVHSNAFCSVFYDQLLESAKGLETYISSINILLKRLSNNENVLQSVKMLAQQTFIKRIKRTLGDCMWRNIGRRNYAVALNAAKVFKQHYALGVRTRLLIFWATLCSYVPSFHLVLECLHGSLKILIRLFQTKRHSDVVNATAVDSYWQYGESLKAIGLTSSKDSAERDKARLKRSDLNEEGMAEPCPTTKICLAQPKLVEPWTKLNQ